MMMCTVYRMCICILLLGRMNDDDMCTVYRMCICILLLGSVNALYYSFVVLNAVLIQEIGDIHW